MKTWTCMALKLVTVTVALEASAGNAVGATVTGRQWHEHKFANCKGWQGWQDCLQKYMRNQKEDSDPPPDPCFYDTGAGTALSILAGRALLQTTGDIPNYAASASTPPAGTGSKPPPIASFNQNPFASSNQAPGSRTATNNAAAGSTPAEETSGNGGATSKENPEPVVEKKPQPIGPDARDFQQTKDFPPGTRLTRDQAALLLSGRGFHHGR